MNKIAIAAGVLAVTVGGFAGATWYTGQQLDKKISQSGELLKDFPIAKVVKRDMRAGFWTSTEEVTYQLGCAGVTSEDPFDGKSFTLTLRNVIRHNPLDMGVDTSVVFDAETRAELSKVFKEQEPLRISTKISMGGELETRLTSPAFTYTEGEKSLDWKGVEAVYKYDRDLSFVNGDLKLPGAKIKTAGDAATQVELGAISYQVNQKRSAEGLYLGKGSLQLAGFTLSEKAKGQPVDVAMGKAVISGESSLKDGMLRVLIKGDADKMQFNKNEVGSFAFDYDFDRLDAKAVGEINKLSLHNGILQCKANPMENMVAMKKQLLEILKKDPKFKHNMKLKTAEGESSLALDIATKGATEQDLRMPQNMLGKLDGSLSVQLPGALVERVIRESKGAEADMALAAYQNSLAQGVAQGFVLHDGKLISSKLIIKNGQLELNGKPIPLGQ